MLSTVSALGLIFLADFYFSFLGWGVEQSVELELAGKTEVL
jgi:hypothetical protein